MDGNNRFVETAKFLNVDYVHQAVENRFSIRLTSRITTEEYQARILAVSRAYSVIGALSDIRAVRDRWFVLSFRAVTSGNSELQLAQSEAGAVLRGNVYRIELCERAPEDQWVAITNKLQQFPVRNLRMFFASLESVLVLSKGEGDPQWASAPSEI
jgi:hypothetical protein